jgi:hypothetical protein
LPKNDETANSNDIAITNPNLVYVKDMLGQLHSVSEAEGADMLSYLIEMAFIECGEIIAQSRPVNLGFQDKRNKTT